MKFSAAQKRIAATADRLEIVWFDGDVFMGWEKSAGFAIRIYNAAGWLLLQDRRCVPVVWKTAFGAARAASKLCPGVELIIDGES